MRGTNPSCTRCAHFAAEPRRTRYFLTAMNIATSPKFLLSARGAEVTPCSKHTGHAAHPQTAALCRDARSLTLVITTRPETFSVTFHWIVTLLPLEIACR